MSGIGAWLALLPNFIIPTSGLPMIAPEEFECPNFV
jgi:hypothetical protein